MNKDNWSSSLILDSSNITKLGTDLLVLSFKSVKKSIGICSYLMKIFSMKLIFRYIYIIP